MQGKPPTGARLDASDPINAGLVGCWLMDERGGQRVRDLRGVNHATGTGGPAWDQLGLKFTSGPKYLNCGNNASVQITGKISISCWFWAYSFAAYGGIVVKGYDGSHTGFQLNFQNDVNTGSAQAIIFASYDGAAHGTYYPTTGNISLGRWYHLVGTQDSVTWRLWINGVNVASTADAFGPASTTKSLLIGASDFGSLFPFDGYVENVRLYNRALSRQEIQKLYVQPWAGLVTKHRRAVTVAAAEPDNLGGFLVFM